MPQFEVEVEEEYIEHSGEGSKLTIKAGPISWMVIYCDHSTMFDNTEPTTAEENLKKAIEAISESLKPLKKISRIEYHRFNIYKGSGLEVARSYRIDPETYDWNISLSCTKWSHQQTANGDFDMIEKETNKGYQAFLHDLGLEGKDEFHAEPEDPTESNE